MNYTELDIQKQIKPLAKNGFVAFWQRIWRWWLSVWYGFADKHPKLSKWIYMIFFFIVFSEGVTIYQMLVLIFLPHIFGLDLAAVDFMWPKVPISLFGVDYYWCIFGANPVHKVADDLSSPVIIGGGLGYFIAFEIAVFTAQCINFPLQRNITYRSHGNPWYQAMWYFIGWILISIFTNALNNFWIPIGAKIMPPFVYSILAMVTQGGIAMVIFFFIFLVIFPDNEKCAQKAQKKLDAMDKEKNPEAYAKQEAKTEEYRYAALLTKTEKDEIAAKTLASSRAIKYGAVKKAKVKAGQEEKHEASSKKAFDEACEAIGAKEEAIKAREAAIALKQ